MTRDEKLQWAGDYALGLLEGDERTAFESAMAGDPELAAMARRLAASLGALDDTATATANPAMWDAIEKRLGEVPRETPKPANDNRSRPTSPLALLAASVIVALGLGYLTGRTMSPPAPQPSMVAVLVNATDQSPGAIIEAFGDDSVHIVPLEQFEVPEGSVLQVWTLPDAQTGPVSLGTLDAARDVRLQGPSLPAPASGQLYEITLEPAPGSPTGKPTGPILVKGFAKAPI